MNLNRYKYKYSNEENKEEDNEEENENIQLTEEISNNKDNNQINKKNKKRKKEYNICEKILLIAAISIFIFCIISFNASLKYYDAPNKNLTKYETINNIENISINSNNNIEQKNKEAKEENINDYYINETRDNYLDNLIELNKHDNEKIKIVFAFSMLFGNGIGRFITVTANRLIETGKYDIYLITGKPYKNDFKYNSTIKRYYFYKNRTLLSNFVNSTKVDFYILENDGRKSEVNFYRSSGAKVIGIFHGLYMSAMFHGIVSSYRNWIDFDYYDAFVFIGYDDYFFYKKLGFKNEIFIPNLYTFEPSETKSSNLTSHNIIMLGRLNDKIKGAIYAVKTMSYIVKEVPDAKLIIYNSNGNSPDMLKLAKNLNITNNIIFNSFSENITENFLKSSVLMYTSLSEAFPMAMIEAKAHGLPVAAFYVAYSPPYHHGVINVDMFDCQALANEIIKLLKDYNYRKKMGEKSKLSLNQFKNNETVQLWGRLFDSLLEGNDAYRKLQKEIEEKYYDEEKARQRVETSYGYLLKYNKNFTCHSLMNFTNINYTRNINQCPFNETLSSNKTNLTNITLSNYNNSNKNF